MWARKFSRKNAIIIIIEDNFILLIEVGKGDKKH